MLVHKPAYHVWELSTLLLLSRYSWFLLWFWCRFDPACCLRSSFLRLMRHGTLAAFHSHVDFISMNSLDWDSNVPKSASLLSSMSKECQEYDKLLGKEDSSSGIDMRVHLLSLEWCSDDCDPAHYSKAVRDIWRWKDETLGDGRDFFVPRPKSLQALQSYLISKQADQQKWDFTQQNESTAQSLDFDECIVLSNCARFEILIVLKQCSPTPRDASNLLKLHFSRRILAQIAVSSNGSVWPRLPGDWPDSIVPIKRLPAALLEISPTDTESLRSLMPYWTHVSGLQSVMEHLCLVSAGMARRPRRPDRPVLFQPFSSREAHILLQLKRTVAIAVASTCPTLVRLLQCVLRAGKAARNPNEVPDLLRLRTYGTGDSIKYDSQPPSGLMNEVAQIVRKQVINPIVVEYVENERVYRDQSYRITLFRKMSMDLARTEDERQWIQQAIHEPTMKLRRAEYLDEMAFLQDIQTRLEDRRTASTGKHQNSKTTSTATMQ